MMRPPTILIVDDEPLMRRVLEILLQRVGLAVIHANDAAEAIERAKAELPDLIVSNIEMPGMDGYELLRAIRALPETDSYSICDLDRLSGHRGTRQESIRLRRQRLHREARIRCRDPANPERAPHEWRSLDRRS
jgi:CheY-like chemotaxis protein